VATEGEGDRVTESDHWGLLITLTWTVSGGGEDWIIKHETIEGRQKLLFPFVGKGKFRL
jgi:hypothetical protein